jgi:hypothetical protein
MFKRLSDLQWGQLWTLIPGQMMSQFAGATRRFVSVLSEVWAGIWAAEQPTSGSTEK